MPRRRRWFFNRFFLLAALGVVVAFDFWAVVLPAQGFRDPFTTESNTQISRHSRSFAKPNVQIAPEVTPPRLLYGDEATRVPERGDRVVEAKITWPFPTEYGLFTPSIRGCQFSFQSEVPETDQLRAAFVTRFNADAAFSALPAWCRESMVAPSGRVTRVVWGLFLHDLALLAAVLAFAALAFMALRDALRSIVHPLGCCSSCGYDLTGLKADACPECGSPRTTAD